MTGSASRSTAVRDVNLSGLDLNLLVVFDMILIEQSVSRAAERLHLTQSAVSHALSRLRLLLHDPLFVRTPQGMQPTAHAEALAGPVAAVLRDIRTLLVPSAQFDPATSTQRFTLGMTDYVAAVVMPALARRMTAGAPHVRLVVQPSNARSCGQMIENGGIDLYVGSEPPHPPNFLASSPLYADEAVCVARAGHPALSGGLSRDDFLHCAHLHISPFGALGAIDQALASQRVTRRIAMTIGDFLVAPSIIEQSDLIAVLPRRIAEPMLARYALAMTESPFDFGAFPIRQTWHRRFDKDPGLNWLKSEIEAACSR
ncbi:LysR family transcriptional regulator [Sphingobium sp. EM0848]|uniref:LysR family transcriptional regulator n=1 Tax=Sphingobium sp. EM0848 TaxID=2743473 RepID=UPI00159C04CE|nr:LysR family transcriptional regulator [Sphingobium sp. EM0848]